MIIDKISNAGFYGSFVKGLDAGMEAIKPFLDQKDPEIGRHEFDGGYFMIQKGQTKPIEEGTFEAHRKYIDVQIILDGSEEVAWAEIGDCTTAIEYNPEKDAERLEGDRSHHMLISAGMFYLVWPHDVHKPVSHTKEQQSFTKIVMKLPVE